MKDIKSIKNKDFLHLKLFPSFIQALLRDLSTKYQLFQNNGCSIRHGDPDKCRYSVTTNQKFFKEKPLERVEPCGPNYVSSVVLGDDRGEWSLENYRTKRGPLPRVETRM